VRVRREEMRVWKVMVSLVTTAVMKTVIRMRTRSVGQLNKGSELRMRRALYRLRSDWLVTTDEADGKQHVLPHQRDAQGRGQERTRAAIAVVDQQALVEVDGQSAARDQDPSVLPPLQRRSPLGAVSRTVRRVPSSRTRPTANAVERLSQRMRCMSQLVMKEWRTRQMEGVEAEVGTLLSTTTALTVLPLSCSTGPHSLGGSGRTDGGEGMSDRIRHELASGAGEDEYGDTTQRLSE
jgi:hypothetical protein